VLALPVDREMIASTVEGIRLVAKEAREVVEVSRSELVRAQAGKLGS
tara:strand:- start:92 stop:232 length:141 start_codon:yes stop_codon:yes gene_type:complete